MPGVARVEILTTSSVVVRGERPCVRSVLAMLFVAPRLNTISECTFLLFSRWLSWSVQARKTAARMCVVEIIWWDRVSWVFGLRGGGVAAGWNCVE